MLLSTTSTLDGHEVAEYKGIVTGEAILGANIFRDLFAGIRDIVGGRAGAYEKVLRGARASKPWKKCKCRLMSLVQMPLLVLILIMRLLADKAQC